ncbi:MAG TPA: phosphoribosylformylglycinamidine cyclo-ligase [Verrucomicrobiales bacterium]|nr:phosphoribosylformylglycinamidine cyclo-ligase [Verrucomicrobiales bacterium]
MAESFTYKEAGVDIEEAAALVRDIGQLRRRTEKRRQLCQAFGLFAAAYDLSDYRNPVIVTGCDGVGTKLELLLRHDLLETAGKDLVAMNVNDILTTGASPVMFLDYLGLGRLDRDRIRRLIAGMAEYLEDCGCILAGGETAEMPGLVAEDVIELSGFCIGAAEREDLVDPGRIARGDVVIGWPSSGFHANGWSLVRRVLAHAPDRFSEEELRALLAPTRLYHREVEGLMEAGVRSHGFAHITGGGIPENLGRLLGNQGARLRVPRPADPGVARVLEYVEDTEAIKTFNLGYGWTGVIRPEDVEAALGVGTGARVLGEIGGQALEVVLEG